LAPRRRRLRSRTPSSKTEWQGGLFKKLTTKKPVYPTGFFVQYITHNPIKTRAIKHLHHSYFYGKTASPSRNRRNPMLNRLIQNPDFIKEIICICPTVNGLSETTLNGSKVICLNSSQPARRSMGQRLLGFFKKPTPIPLVMDDGTTVQILIVHVGDLQPD
jgi:hypothetical protein